MHNTSLKGFDDKGMITAYFIYLISKQFERKSLIIISGRLYNKDGVYIADGAAGLWTNE